MYRNMSQEEIITEAVTRIITKVQRIKWTIKKVSEMVEEIRYDGPKVYYNEAYIGHIAFQIENGNISIQLLNKSKKAIKMLKSKVALLDSNGKKLREAADMIYYLGKRGIVQLLVRNRRVVMKSLKDDKLIIDCCLKFVGECNIKYLKYANDRGYQKRNERNVLKDLKKLCNDPESSDVIFKIEDGIIHAHKTVLSFRSEYFKRMFAAKMKEEIQNSVLITDVSYSTMKNLIEWIYTGYFREDSFQDICSLYVAADKYQIIDLKELCADKLRSAATVDNLIEILKLSASHNDNDLKSDALRLIFLHLADIVKTNTWKALQLSEAELASEVLDFYFKATLI